MDHCAADPEGGRERVCVYVVGVVAGGVVLAQGGIRETPSLRGHEKGSNASNNPPPPQAVAGGVKSRLSRKPHPLEAVTCW